MSSTCGSSDSDESPLPKWRRPPARKIGSMRYSFKMTLLFLACVALGLSVSLLYSSQDNDEAAALGSPDSTSDANSGTTSSKTSQKTYKDLASLDRQASIKGGKFKSATSGSMYTKFSNGFAALKPWKKPFKSAKQEEGEEQYTAAEGNETFGEHPRIAKITINTADNDNELYERALLTHAVHNRLHNYPMFTLRNNIMEKDGIWSKPAYILSVILRELAKPVSERLHWLLWVDADTVILNPNVPVDLLLPPAGWTDVNMLITEDFNGLNNGVFPIRVCSWSVELLTAVMSFPHYKPHVDLEWRDQSAMSELMKEHRFKRHTIKAPQRWFNGYPGELNDTLAPFQIRRGDLLVHFAGFTDRDERMGFWLDRAEQHDPDWELDLKSTTYPAEVREFWHDQAKIQKDQHKASDESRDKAEQLHKDVSSWIEKYPDVLDAEHKNDIDIKMRKLIDYLGSEKYKDLADEFDAVVNDLKVAANPLMTLVSKMSKTLFREAHDIIIEIESDGRLTIEESEIAHELHLFKQAFYKLKAYLFEKDMNPERIGETLDALRSASATMQKKYKDVKGYDFVAPPREEPLYNSSKTSKASSDIENAKSLHWEPPPAIWKPGEALKSPPPQSAEQLEAAAAAAAAGTSAENGTNEEARVDDHEKAEHTDVVAAAAGKDGNDAAHVMIPTEGDAELEGVEGDATEGASTTVDEHMTDVGEASHNDTKSEALNATAGIENDAAKSEGQSAAEQSFDSTTLVGTEEASNDTASEEEP